MSPSGASQVRYSILRALGRGERRHHGCRSVRGQRPGVVAVLDAVPQRPTVPAPGENSEKADSSRAGFIERNGGLAASATGSEQHAALKDDVSARPQGRSGVAVVIGRASPSCSPTGPPPGSQQGKTRPRPGRLIRDFQQGTVLCGVPETPDG